MTATSERGGTAAVGAPFLGASLERSRPIPAAFARSRSWPPLFERILYYGLAPELFGRVVLEAGFNQYWYHLVQPKLWVFYLLMLVEFGFQFLTIFRWRLRWNLGIVPFVLLGIMGAHGTIVGLAWGNGLAKVMTDTIPVLVTAVNVLLLNRAGAFDGFSFTRLRRVIIVYSLVMVWVGVAAVAAGQLSTVSLGGQLGQPVCMTVLLVHLAIKDRINVADLALLALIVGPTVPNSNRTTLAVFLVVFAILIAPRILAAGRQIYFTVLLVAGLGGAFVLLVPEDSPVMVRVQTAIERVTADRAEETGALYERDAEWAAIGDKLRELGTTAEWFGYGAGGTYQVVFSGGIIPENYSHAHYGWALFRLRYGNVGYLYLVAYGLCVLGSAVQARRNARPASRIVFILCIWCFIFLFTYAALNFLCAGLQFAPPDRVRRPRALRPALPGEKGADRAAA